MKRLVILGAGTAGTMMANKMSRILDRAEWKIVVLDRNNIHYYQPGFLLIPFGKYKAREVEKRKSDYLNKGVEFIVADIRRVDAARNVVVYGDMQEVVYDILIVATGAVPKPSETPGLLGERWYKSIFDFYTLEGAVALAGFLEKFEGGKLVMTITELPYKCPIAPLEFVFLADAFFTQKGIRDKVEIFFTTPMSGAFTKPIATKMLSSLLDSKRINVVTDFYVEGVDDQKNIVRSYDGREVEFDCLVVVPVNLGDEVIAASGLGDDMNYVMVDKETLQSPIRSNVFAIGDAANLPTSKAGSVAHFSAEILAENLKEYLAGCPLSHRFDGHSNCFIETGFGKATLIDFDYTHEPYPGEYPVAGVGPMKLLEVTRINHWGKLAFRPIYWEFLLKDRRLPVSNRFSMSGKHV